MSDILARLNGNGEPWTFAEVAAEITTLRQLVKAALRFIDANVADPDITNEMADAWMALQKLRT